VTIYYFTTRADNAQWSALPTSLFVLLGGIYVFALGNVFRASRVYGSVRDALGRLIHIGFLGANCIALIHLILVGTVASAPPWQGGPPAPAGWDAFQQALLLFGATGVLGLVAWITSGFPPCVENELVPTSFLQVIGG
jgi:hypothetical protein